MQVEKGCEWSYGAYALERRELLPEETNIIYYVSLVVSEIIERIGKLPFCEVKELPDWKKTIHIIIDSDAQKLFEKFHRYSCPFEAGGVIKEKYDSLIGTDNLLTNLEEASKRQRSTLHAFFTHKRIEELKPIWKRITQEWVVSQTWKSTVSLFDASLKLVSQCLIQGIMGYNRCSEADVNLNTSFWKTLLDPTPSEQKLAEEYERQGEPGVLLKAYNFYLDSTTIIAQGKAYYHNYKAIDQLVKKIYDSTILIKGSMSQYLQEEGYEEKMILENLKGMLIAGQETVGYLLGFILYEYARNTFMQDNHSCITANIKNAYLEALRLYSVAGVQREAGCDMVLKQEGKEHYIRKGDIIACVPLLSGKDENKWNDPETFNPDRENLGEVKKIPHFGSGAHECIGKKVAEAEILTILEEILSNANLTTTETLSELLNAFTIRPKQDVLVSFKSSFVTKF